MIAVFAVTHTLEFRWKARNFVGETSQNLNFDKLPHIPALLTRILLSFSLCLTNSLSHLDSFLLTE